MHNICVTFSSIASCFTSNLTYGPYQRFLLQTGFPQFLLSLGLFRPDRTGFPSSDYKREKEQVFRLLSETFFSPLFSQPSHLWSVQKKQGFLHNWPLSLPSRTSLFTPSGQFFSLRHICKNVKQLLVRLCFTLYKIFHNFRHFVAFFTLATAGKSEKPLKKAVIFFACSECH